MDLGLSVVTPSFNQGRFLERTIQSVITQDVGAREYVIMDGASSDETRDLLKHYEDRLRWVSERDDGQTDAVNKGLRATRHPIVGWINSDDIYYSGAFRAVLEAFAAHPEVDVVYGEANHIDENDAVLELYYTEPFSLERLKDVCFLCQPAVFFRRRLVERIGPLNVTLKYCMDYEYWLRAALSGARFLHLPRVLAGSRLHAATKTLGSRLPVHREINQMLRATLGKVPDRWLFNFAHVAAEQRGITRQTPVRFASAVGVSAIYASLRWNRGVTKPLAQQSAKWALAAARDWWRARAA